MIPEDERTKIFRTYYGLADYTRQRDFISANADKIVKKTSTTQQESRRAYSIFYYLPVNGEKRKLCKSMFLNTLAINKGIVDIAMKKRSEHNVAAADRRGKGKSFTLNSALVDSIVTHIESFPCVPSHYCREDTTRKYLDSSLNLATMYRIPSEEVKQNFIDHQKSKKLARQEKINDRDIATASNGKVLLCPTDPTNNALFYKQRLSTYNFTIYNVVTKQGDCNMGHEGQGGRGSCEIASYVYPYFKSLPNTVEEVRCFSDRCGGQNLNKYMVAMCMHAVQSIENIKVIELKFLVSGHGEMECDSMHSAINTEFKRVGKALWPGDWKVIARSARKKGDKPYNVFDVQCDRKQNKDSKRREKRKRLLEDLRKRMEKTQKMLHMALNMQLQEQKIRMKHSLPSCSKSNDTDKNDPDYILSKSACDCSEEDSYTEQSFLKSLPQNENYVPVTEVVNEEKEIACFILEEVLDQVMENFTARGEKRKTKKHKTTLEERRRVRKVKIVAQHAVKESCAEVCKKHCTKKITADRRLVVNKSFWSMSVKEQKNYFFSNCKQRPQGIDQEVCKTFFYQHLVTVQKLINAYVEKQQWRWLTGSTRSSWTPYFWK
nr:unnamed protein product [Callosobruchus chinensis]